MSRSAWYVILGVALMAGLSGCSDDDGTVIDIDAAEGDGGVVDAAMPSTEDGGPVVCGSLASVGGLCRTGSCRDGLTCLQEIRIMGAQLTARNTFEIAQAEPADPTQEIPDSFVEVTTPNPANDIPITFIAGSMCTEQCDVTVAQDMTTGQDMCGSCARCSNDVGGDTIGVGILPFFPTAERIYGNDTGLCRSICNFAVDTNGGCPTGYTCDGFTNICLESCRNDAQCNAALVITEQGEYGTWRVPDGGRTCDTTTGRCRWEGPADAHVGDSCDGVTDCQSDTGICLRGGTCGQTQCGVNPTTTQDGICDDGRGVCLRTGGYNGTVCLGGCTTSDDCNPGNACLLFGEPATIGPFAGYCLGLCDTVMSSATDEIVTCGHGEQCDMPAADEEDMDPDGTCRATCDPAAGSSGCDDGDLCVGVTGQTYGFCRSQNQPCFTHTDCFGGQVCDNVAGPALFGRCVDRCTATSCAAGTECITEGDNAGVCARPCDLPTDGGVRDAGVPDAGSDAGQDAGEDDAGEDEVDAAVIDAAVIVDGGMSVDGGVAPGACATGFSCVANGASGFCIDS